MVRVTPETDRVSFAQHMDRPHLAILGNQFLPGAPQPVHALDKHSPVGLRNGAAGFVRPVLVETFLILFTTFPYLGLDDAIRGSAIAPLFLDGGPVLLKLLPGTFDDAVDAF